MWKAIDGRIGGAIAIGRIVSINSIVGGHKNAIPVSVNSIDNIIQRIA
jgi:hypothetical protein